MAVRSTMADLISRVRTFIADPSGTSSQFSDQQIQDYLDATRDDVRYEALTIAPSIVNNPSTGNQAVTVFADYYSTYQWWEQDVTLQGTNTATGAAWVVLTPLTSDYITGHWQFEIDVFNSGTAPGQYPPVFATGKVYDLYATAADLLQFWGASLAGAYDVTMDGQSMRRSQLMTAKLALADYYRKQCKPRSVKMRRDDVLPEVNSRRMRLLDNRDTVRGQ